MQLRVAASGIALLLAWKAEAAVLAFEGTLSIVVPEFLTCLPPEELPPGEGACGWPMVFDDDVAGVADIELTPGGGLASIELAGGLFHMTGTRYVYDSSGRFFPIVSMVVTASNQAGALGPGGGVVPLAGFVKVCLYAQCGSPFNANLSVPLEAIGASAEVTHIGGAVEVTALGAPWTTGSIMAGVANETVSGSSAPGVLNLVTPISFSTNIGAFARVELGYARLVLHYVPEPATALLLGAGVLGLVVRARALRR